MSWLFPVSFWGGWTAGIVIIGFLGWAWLAAGVYRAKDVHSPEQVWDDNLREGNDTPPQWWFYVLFSMLIFSSIYIMLYPGFGNNQGYFQWNQYKQLEDGLAYYHERTDDIKQRWETTALDELGRDESAMHTARRLYAVNCAACHGINADGQAELFPSLMDDEWHWGNSETALLHSIREGRNGAMPGWEASLTNAQIRDVSDYVYALSQDKADATDAAHPGKAVYTANCVACHGISGEGNPTLGAPRLINHRWVYTKNGDIRAGIEETVRNGRNGVMPAQKSRLTAAQIRLLAAWLAGGKQIAPVSPE